MPGLPIGPGDVLATLVSALPRGTGRILVGIDGVDGSGKTTFADSFGRYLSLS